MLTTGFDKAYICYFLAARRDIACVIFFELVTFKNNLKPRLLIVNTLN